MLTPGVPCTLLAISYRVASCPPAECPAMTIFARFGKIFLSASLRTMSSMKSKDESVGLLGDMPPARHELRPSGHITSFAIAVSLPAVKRGATMIVFSPVRLPSRNNGPRFDLHHAP